MIVHGGYNGSTLGDVWSFTPSTGQWAELSPSGTAPSARSSEVAVYDSRRARMVIWGGPDENVYSLSLSGSPAWSQITTSGSGPSHQGNAGCSADYDRYNDWMVLTVSGSIYRLHLGTNVWASLGFSEGMFGGTTTVYDAANHHIISFGGYDIGSCVVAFDNLEVMDTTGTAVAHNYTGPAVDHATAIYDPRCQRMLVFGGTTDFNCANTNCVFYKDFAVSNDVWSFSLPSTGSGSWTQLSPIGDTPVARSRHTAVLDRVKNEMYVFGGGNNYSSCTYLNDVHALAIADSTAPVSIDYVDESGCSMSSVVLKWAAPRDDNGAVIESYDIRRSTSAITDANWNSATQVFVGVTPVAPDSTQTATVGGLNSCTWYYFAIKSRDQALNWSSASYNLHAKSKCLSTDHCFNDNGLAQRLTPPSEGAIEVNAFGIVNVQPNPTRQDVLVDFALSSETHAPADLSVFDLTGRRVATLASNLTGKGSRSTTWNLLDAEGRRVQAGMYWIRLTSQGMNQARPVVVR